LFQGHTIPNGDPATPFAENKALNTLLLLPTTVFNQDFWTLKLKDKSIIFFTLIPLYTEKVEMKT